MTITYQLTPEDFISLQKDLIKNTNYHKRRSKFLLIYTELLAFAYGFAAVVWFFPRVISFTAFVLVAIASGVLVMLLLYPLLRKMYPPITLRKSMVQLKKMGGWPRTVTVKLDDSGIEWTSDNPRSKGMLQIPWESIDKASQDEKHLYLYFQEADAIIIPKKINGLDSIEQSELERLLNPYMKARS
ncbi:YcxB family protein [Exiguobacterium sp. SL-9]|uniref:YcxB family protein n=1 Tax=Exiguobacterium sp. SL-9 TaxID=2510963 RepID=UPI00103FED7E|nr:YcxB family protein [Exiguobacterium sp. SL-9]TCI20443.1 YcxB family protein [Exiguobacterium sp. SL-9]